jgi:ABC-type phosphate transport system substrate-binding protein
VSLFSTLQKTSAQINAYWSRSIFTGKGEPPRKVADDAEVMALVAADPGVIGYVGIQSVNSSVKVLLKIP